MIVRSKYIKIEMELTMENYFEKILQNDSIPRQIRETVYSEMRHALEVSNIAVLISKELGKDEKFCDDIAVAGVLHDIGKLRVNRYVYSDDSDDTLVVEQMKYVRMHSAYSRDILTDEDYPANIIEAVYHHHENYDGSGYPDGLKGNNIPEMSRILRTCDVFSALITDRSYRKAFDKKTAMAIMIDEVEDYDMEVFLAFQRVFHADNFPEIEKLQQDATELQMKHFNLFEKEAVSF